MSTIREETERIEREILAPWAQLAAESKGRDRPEEADPLRTAYQRDRDRIVHCKAFRRLKHKTQVFAPMAGDHFRVRLTHTLEVGQISRTIARALRLNEDLTEAISLGHDLGHTPFGHIGEAVLSTALGRPFRHAEQSLRVVEVLEYGGRGLNLTNEVRDGIVNHTWAQPTPATLEAHAVRFGDRIAYLNHDLDDAIRAGFVTLGDVPEGVLRTLGRTHAERINAMVMAIVEESRGEPRVGMLPEPLHAMQELREFLFDRVYLSPQTKPDRERAERVISNLFEFYADHPEELPEEYQAILGPAEVRAADYVAGMTDGYALNKHLEIYGE